MVYKPIFVEHEPKNRSRGVNRLTFRWEAVERALNALTQIPVPPDPRVDNSGHRPINYRRDPGFNGGFNPFAPHCASWSYGDRTPTSDCIGFLLHSAGIDRLQPGYSGSVGEWLHCGSLLADATSEKIFVEKVAENQAQCGDWLLTADHCAMIVRPAIFVLGDMRHDHLVIDCSPRHDRAAAIGIGKPWSEACTVVRYKHYAGEYGNTLYRRVV